MDKRDLEKFGNFFWYLLFIFLGAMTFLFVVVITPSPYGKYVGLIALFTMWLYAFLKFRKFMD